MALFVYKQTNIFQKKKMYGLTSQIRRLLLRFQLILQKVVGRGSDADFFLLVFLQIAFGSASETEYLLLLCFELGYLSKVQYLETNTLIQRNKNVS